MKKRWKNWFKKFAKNAVEEYKMELAQSMVKNEYQCSGCKTLPRSGGKYVRKCTLCSKTFCHHCAVHLCPESRAGIATANSIVEMTLSGELDNFLGQKGIDFDKVAIQKIRDENK